MSIIVIPCRPKTISQVLWTRFASFSLFSCCVGVCGRYFCRKARWVGRDRLRRRQSIVIQKLYNLGVQCRDLHVLVLELLCEPSSVILVPLDVPFEHADFVSILSNFTLESRIDVFQFYYAEFQSGDFAVIRWAVLKRIILIMINVGIRMGP